MLGAFGLLLLFAIVSMGAGNSPQIGIGGVIGVGGVGPQSVPGLPMVARRVVPTRDTSWTYFRITSTAMGRDSAQETWWQQLELADSVGTFTPLDMTGNSSGGFIATAGIVYAAYEPWKAFDAMAGTHWGVINQFTDGRHWIQIQCPTPKTPTKFAAISDMYGGGYTPVGFKIEGSNTGSFSGEQTLLASISTTAWGNSEKRGFTIP